MKLRPAYLLIVLCVVTPGAAKDGIQATVHTAIPADAAEGTRVEINWTLADEKSGKPFSAYGVFIRLIGSGGESTEAFAEYPARPIGSYQTTATIPKGGVVLIEIGVAGTMTDREGDIERSDWLMPLANDPIQE
jgi:hypothetical protein